MRKSGRSNSSFGFGMRPARDCLLRANGAALVLALSSVVTATVPAAGSISDAVKSANGVKTISRSSGSSLARQVAPYSTLANDVYNGGKDAGAAGRVVGDFKVVPDSDYSNSLTGLQYRVYENIETGRKVMAFRGTEGGGEGVKDWAANGSAYLNIGPKNLTLLPPSLRHQYAEALDKAKIALAADPTIEFTGHSLGGGIAQFVASQTGGFAVGFNSAPLPNALVGKRQANVLNICAKGDPVCDWLRKSPGHNNAGQTVMFDPKELAPSSALECDTTPKTSFDKKLAALCAFAAGVDPLPNHQMSLIQQFLYQSKATRTKLEPEICKMFEIDDPNFCKPEIELRSSSEEDFSNLGELSSDFNPRKSREAASVAGQSLDNAGQAYGQNSQAGKALIAAKAAAQSEMHGAVAGALTNSVSSSNGGTSGIDASGGGPSSSLCNEWSGGAACSKP